jgi:hypothetical protein
MREEEILEKAMQQFMEMTGAVMTVLKEKESRTNTKHADAHIELSMGDQKARFRVKVKTEIRDQQLPKLLYQVKDHPKEWLLICQYIPKPLKESLKNQGINYLETAGNCFIRKEGLFFYINDKAVTAERQPKEGKLWNQAGIKFLFGILINPDLLNTPYRQMATTTQVALGNIGRFIEELKQEGFLKEGMKNGVPFLFLEHKNILQNKWTEFFHTVLRPKLKEGTFRFADANKHRQWQDIPVNQFYWGGEPAGAILTGFLEPEILTVYTKLPAIELMKELRLVPDKNGNVEIMHIFWETPMEDLFEAKTTLTVPPLLAYAELMTSLDSRNRETAERIKQQYLG